MLRNNIKIFIVVTILCVTILTTCRESIAIRQVINTESNRLFVIRDQIGKYGYIDEKGRVVIPARFLYANEFSEELGCVRIDNNKFGFIDRTGNFIIPPRFDWAESFSEGLAPVQINNKYGYIDKSGKIIIEPIFTLAWRFHNGLEVVELNGGIGYIDKNSNIVIEPQFRRNCIRSFSEGLAAVNSESNMVDYKIEGAKWGYIDKTGRMVINPQFDEARDFSEGIACVRIGDKWGCIDKTGGWVIKLEFDWICDFTEGVSVVNIGGRKPSRVGGWGVINKTGKIVVEPQFFSVMNPFSEGLLAVQIKQDAKFGYIDKAGNIVIISQFEGAFPFSNGLAKVWIKEDNGNRYKDVYIDKTGKYIWMASVPTIDSKTSDEPLKDKPVDGE